MHNSVKNKGDGAQLEQIQQLEFMLAAKMNMGFAILIVQIMILVCLKAKIYFLKIMFSFLMKRVMFFRSDNKANSKTN